MLKEDLSSRAATPHRMVEFDDQGWFFAETNRYEQEQLAKVHLDLIGRAVDQRRMQGLCPDGRWVNDPRLFPELETHLRATVKANAVDPFPPDDSQYYIRGSYDEKTSFLKPNAIPRNDLLDDGQVSWVRLCDFADHSHAAHLFDDFTGKSHCGRVLQGALDNGYFVEALQAIALRPKLARQLFYSWDSARSIYIARMFKHGTWMRIEVDDYVPVSTAEVGEENIPICCRSERFPHVLWPSLVEKAYAKLHTVRMELGRITSEDKGGWEALSGGGRVEEALADLTGGVCGRFKTSDISADRLFLYLYELQRDTLFVCRPNFHACNLHGVFLNPYYPNVLNRAVEWEGRLYLQMFCGAPGVYDGGLQDLTVPFSLLQNEDYPEKTEDGFFWMGIMDFYLYFDTIFECRLVNSGDTAPPNMPPSRLPPQMPEMYSWASGSPGGRFGQPSGQLGAQHLDPTGVPLPWFEWVFANPGDVSSRNLPEFRVIVPERSAPCDVVCSLEQLDPRMMLTSPGAPMCVPIMVNVYEGVEDIGGGEWQFSKDLVCRSNWLPVRDAMVAFTVQRGSTFKITVELPWQQTGPPPSLSRMIFRCYSNRPQVQVVAHTSLKSSSLVVPIEPPKAVRISLGGMAYGKEETLTQSASKNVPQDLNPDTDSMRVAEMDVEWGFKGFFKDTQDCSVQ